MSAGLPNFDLQAYEPPDSVWKLIEAHAPAHEQDELKTMIGSSLVEESIELHMEVETLLDIWQEYREETESLQVTSRKLLPEPPIIRESLRKEIQFFVHSIRERATEEGRKPDDLLQLHDRDIIDYAFTARSSLESRPQTSHGRSGKEVPMIKSPDSDRSSGNPLPVTEEVAAVSDKLNVMSFDEVVSNLRERLEEEVNQLKRDITFLQNCLDEEATYRDKHQVGGGEPTITDLKRERSKLEDTLLTKPRIASSDSQKGRTKRQNISANIPMPVITHAMARKTSIARANSAKSDQARELRPLRATPTGSEHGDSDVLFFNDSAETKPAWPPRDDCSSVASSRLEPDSDYSSDFSRPGSSGQPDSHSRMIKDPYQPRKITTRKTTSHPSHQHTKVNPKPAVRPRQSVLPPQRSERPSSAQKFRAMVQQTRDERL